MAFENDPDLLEGILEQFAGLGRHRDDRERLTMWYGGNPKKTSPGELFLAGDVGGAIASASKDMSLAAGKRKESWAGNGGAGMPPIFSLDILVRTVKRFGGNRAAAARELGLTPAAVQIAVKKASVDVAHASRKGVSRWAGHVKQTPEERRAAKKAWNLAHPKRNRNTCAKETHDEEAAQARCKADARTAPPGDHGASHHERNRGDGQGVRALPAPSARGQEAA